MAYPPALTLKAKILGAMLRQARQAAGKSVRDVAELIGTPAAKIAAYERGSKAISLPELEIVAYSLNIPLRRFLDARSGALEDVKPVDAASVLPLRQRMIGALIRSDREQMGLSIRDLAKATGLPSGRIASYERGERPIPMPELDLIASALGRVLEDFLETQGPIGEWEASQRASERLREIPADVREFLSQPGNLPYLRLAKRLSEVSVERLRGLAEGLLDITV